MSKKEDCSRDGTLPPPGAQDLDLIPEEDHGAARESAVESLADDHSGPDCSERTEDLGMNGRGPENGAEAKTLAPSGSASPPQQRSRDSKPTESTASLRLAERLAPFRRPIRDHLCRYTVAVRVAVVSIVGVVILAAVFAPTTVVEYSLPIPDSAPWRQRIEDKTPRILLWNNTKGATRRRRYDDVVCDYEGGLSVICNVTENSQCLIDSDAIVFDAHRLGSMWLPSKRAGFQLWVFRAQHPPPPMGNSGAASSSLSLQLIATKFNLTMGYRQDADVVVPFKTWRCTVPTDEPLSENSDSSQTEFKKKKEAAWIHGDCERHSFEKAIRSLHAFDDHGSGNVTATSPADTVRLRRLSACGDHQCSSQRDCIRHVAENYHFILVSLAPECFQSAYEVIYAAFEYDLVPVVLAPPNTRLHVPDDSVVISSEMLEPGQLAAYLRFLLDNRDEYEAYFHWKRNCAVVAPENELCPLCRILWEYPQRQRVHPDVLEWWTRRSLCRDEPLFGLDSAFLPEV